MDDIFGDSIERLFAQIVTPAAIRAIEEGASIDALWQALEDSGFLDALVPESSGGAGLTLAQVFPLFLSAGRHAIPVPFAQTMLARAWLHHVRAPIPKGPITIAAFGMRSGENSISGSAVSFGRTAQWVLADLGSQIVLLPTRGADLESELIADPASLDVAMRWKGPRAANGISGETHPCAKLAEISAVCHASLIAGAADKALALTLDYAGQRTQFGKPIGKFQAVQSQISIMAERTWAARMAAQMACNSTNWWPRPLLAAVGKSRASEAAAVIADIAHAVHGALGITQEYDLQLYTRRLRQWRLAAGNETYWSGRIGEALLRKTSSSALAFICSELSAERL
jgi:alkylation response protein AidB-like acyl-CoA dehydrogenase